RLQHQAEGLAERRTIADEAAPALEVQGAALQRALEIDVPAHAVGPDGGGGPGAERPAQLRDALQDLLPAGVARSEHELGRGLREAVDEDLHGGDTPARRVQMGLAERGEERDGLPLARGYIAASMSSPHASGSPSAASASDAGSGAPSGPGTGPGPGP